MANIEDETERAEFPWSPRERTDFGLPTGFASLSEEERIHWIHDLAIRPTHELTARERITWIVSKQYDPRGIPAVRELLQAETSVAVLRAAHSVLGDMGDPAVVPLLIRGLDSADKAVCVSCILGLGWLRARDAVPRLIDMVRDTRSQDFFQFRVTAAEALVEIRDERGLEPLREAAQSGGLRGRRKLRSCAEQLATALGLDSLT